MSHQRENFSNLLLSSSRVICQSLSSHERFRSRDSFHIFALICLNPCLLTKEKMAPIVSAFRRLELREREDDCGSDCSTIKGIPLNRSCSSDSVNTYGKFRFVTFTLQRSRSSFCHFSVMLILLLVLKMKIPIQALKVAMKNHHQSVIRQRESSKLIYHRKL